MTISYVYTKVNTAMKLLETINLSATNKSIKTKNQKDINKAYDILDSLKDELIREHIKAKQNLNKIDKEEK